MLACSWKCANNQYIIMIRNIFLVIFRNLFLTHNSEKCFIYLKIIPLTPSWTHYFLDIHILTYFMFVIPLRSFFFCFCIYCRNKNVKTNVLCVWISEHIKCSSRFQRIHFWWIEFYGLQVELCGCEKYCIHHFCMRGLVKFIFP